MNIVKTEDVAVGSTYRPIEGIPIDVEVVAKTSSGAIGRSANGDFEMMPNSSWLYVDRTGSTAHVGTDRAAILDTARTAVTKDRAATHGDLESNFSDIAQIWSVRLGRTVTNEQVALMMVDVKTVRAWGNPKHVDNWVDIAGYAACGGELADVS